MCLILSDPNKVFKADKDIEVFKEIDLGSMITPYQQTEIKVNSKLVAEGTKDISQHINKYSVSSGYIHAYLISDVICVKAFIPKGTIFYIQDDFEEICAEQLYITDEIVLPGESPDLKYLAQLITTDKEAVFEDFKVLLQHNFGKSSFNNAIVSLDYFNCTLPSIEQLQVICKNMLYINAISLYNNFPVKLKLDWYWSSTLHDSVRAKYLNFDFGYSYSLNFNSRGYVLGVSVL